MPSSKKWIFEASSDSKDNPCKEDQSGSESSPASQKIEKQELDEDSFSRQQRDLELVLDCF